MKHTTRHFQNQNTIVFGPDMAGVVNPIITFFTIWPVRRLELDIPAGAPAVFFAGGGGATCGS